MVVVEFTVLVVGAVEGLRFIYEYLSLTGFLYFRDLKNAAEENGNAEVGLIKLLDEDFGAVFDELMRRLRGDRL